MLLACVFFPHVDCKLINMMSALCRFINSYINLSGLPTVAGSMQQMALRTLSKAEVFLKLLFRVTELPEKYDTLTN